MAECVRSHFLQALRVLFGDDEQMTLGQGSDIQEGEDRFVLPDPQGGDFTGHYLAENAVGIAIHGKTP
jgi:hypothetical protein